MKSLTHRTNIIILMFIGFMMLSFSWGKWMDVWVDYGDDLFIQWKVLHGAVLYRDIAYFRGPVSIYLNTAFFKLFGTSILTLVITHVLMVAAVTILTYLFFLETSGLLSALMTSFVFLTCFAFSNYIQMGNFNFVCPYTYSIVDGYFFALLGIYIFLQWVKKGRNALLFLLGIISGVVFLIKVEIFAAFFLAILIGLMLWEQYLRRPDQFTGGKIFLVLISGALIPFLCFWIYFSHRMPCSQAFHALILQYIPNANIPKDSFYLHISGLENPFYNTFQLLDNTIVYIMTFILVAVFAFLSFQSKLISTYKPFKFFFLIVLVFILWRNLDPIFIMHIFRPLPLVILLFGIFLQWSFIKARAATPQMVSLSVFTFFAFMLMMKLILFVTITGYGFILALPATLLLVVIMLQYLPKLIGDLFNGTEETVRHIFLVLISVGIFLCVQQSSMAYLTKNIEITNGRDPIISFNPEKSGEGIQFQEALNFVNTQLNPTDTFLVLPEGALLNYLSRKDTGTHYFKIAVAEEDLWTQESMLEDFKQHPPNYIIYKRWRGFGAGNLAPKIFSWVINHYQQVKLIKAPNEANLIIAKRK